MPLARCPQRGDASSIHEYATAVPARGLMREPSPAGAPQTKLRRCAACAGCPQTPRPVNSMPRKASYSNRLAAPLRVACCLLFPRRFPLGGPGAQEVPKGPTPEKQNKRVPREPAGPPGKHNRKSTSGFTPVPLKCLPRGDPVGGTPCTAPPHQDPARCEGRQRLL